MIPPIQLCFLAAQSDSKISDAALLIFFLPLSDNTRQFN